MGWVRFVVATSLLLVACTQPADDDPASPSEEPTPSAPASASPVPVGARLPDGAPLPDGCTGGAGGRHTVAFVDGGRAWALDPDDGDVACLFPVDDPGMFAWGPQGDRVLLGDFEVRGVGAGTPDLPPVDAQIGAFDWGHPLGLAVVFADEDGDPRKRFVEDGRVVRLVSLPPGRYLEVAYHPSGLALAFVVETEEGQEIWLSTNEGEDPQRLVFSEIGTEFTSLAFTPNGRTLWWSAQHAEGYPELHFMDLDDRSGFGTAWRGKEGTVVHGLRLAPDGRLMSVTQGKACGKRRAFIVDEGTSAVALPDETRPTEALGWLDPTTLLVATGGCGDPLDLYAVDGSGKDAPAALILGVELGAPRTKVTNPPREVPAPSAEEEPPSTGVG
jgi:hypothetical protein